MRVNMAKSVPPEVERAFSPCARFLAAALAFALLFAGLGAPSKRAQAAVYPSESACDTSWYDEGAGSFTLSTPEQLAGLAYLVSEEGYSFAGKTVTLANDIDLSGICAGGVDWRPIGSGYSEGTAFGGTFDGGDHTISGLKIDNSGYYNALFGSVSHATIKNFTVQGSVYGSDYVAGIVSLCNDSDLLNLTSECNVDALKYNEGTSHQGRAAGVVCYVATAYPTSNMTFEKLVNKGDVVATAFYTGGVAGFLYCANGFSISVSECANYGNVSVAAARYGADDANNACGGVIGSTAGAYGTYLVNGCVNEGDVTSANLAATGGVAGYLGGNGSTLSYSSNTGSVSGPNAAGGVAGFFGASGGTLSNTLNTGSVAGGQTGAIVGASSNAGQSYALNYTLDSAMPQAYGPDVGADGSDAAVTADELRTQDFLDLINDGDDQFAILSSVNNGFPILAWTNPSAIPGQGGIRGESSDDSSESSSTKEEKAAEDDAEKAKEAEEAAEQAEKDAEEKGKEAEEAEKEAEEAEKEAEEAEKEAEEAEKEAEKAQKEAEKTDPSDEKAKKAAEKKAKEAADAAKKARDKADEASKKSQKAGKTASEKEKEAQEASEESQKARKAQEAAQKKASESQKAAQEARKKSEEKAKKETEQSSEKQNPGEKQDSAKNKARNQTVDDRQNGTGTGVRDEDPAQYERPDDGHKDAITPSAIASFDDPPANPPDAPGDSGQTAADEQPQSEPASQPEPQQPAQDAGEQPVAEDASEVPEEAESANAAAPGDAPTARTTRQMVELAAVAPDRQMGGDAAPELVALCLGVAALFVGLGVVRENVAFSRAGGGWKRNVAPSRQTRVADGA